MNATCPTLAEQPVPARLTFLQRFLGRGRMLPVDLADTIFARPVNRDALAASLDAHPGPFPGRPDHARVMPLRLP